MSILIRLEIKPSAATAGRVARLAAGALPCLLAIFVGIAAGPLRGQTVVIPQVPRDAARRGERSEPPNEWVTDNMDIVSASATQIKDVLAKEPGLMVELKRLIARQATEKGQIVTEKDLEDEAILDRLAADTRFRALATRLLQRYGYLSPQINPLSASGREQDLLLKARAERLARTTDDNLPETQSARGCEQGKDDPSCLVEPNQSSELATEPAADERRGFEATESSCDPDQDGADCDSAPSPRTSPRRPVTTQPSEPDGPDVPDSPPRGVLPTPYMTASMASTTAPSKPNARLGDTRQDELADVTAGMPPVLPEFPKSTSPSQVVSPRVSSRRSKDSTIPEPVETVRFSQSLRLPALAV